MRLDQVYRVVSICEDDRVDRRILDGARMLSEEGWPTLVIAKSADGNRSDELSYPDVPILRVTSQFQPGGVLAPDLLPLERFTGQMFALSRRLAAAACAFPAEVYIANDLPQLAAGIIAARTHGATLIYDAHEMYAEQAFAKERGGQLTAIERALLAHADAVVTVNDSLADLFAMHYGCRRPHVVLNCPTSRHQRGNRVDDGRLRAHLGLTGATRIVLYQGNLVAFRNLEQLIDGMALVQSPDVVLAIMGRASAFGETLKARVASQAEVLGRRVFFVPEQSAADLLAWTIGADAGIIPYQNPDLQSLLCTPNKLYEFLLAGLPILSAHGMELRRFVGDLGVGRNYHLATPSDFAAAIDDFFLGPIAEWRSRSSSLSMRFSWETEGRKWFDIIRNAQANHAARRAPAAPAMQLSLTPAMH